MDISTDSIEALRQSFTDKLGKENGKQALCIIIYDVLKRV